MDFARFGDVLDESTGLCEAAKGAAGVVTGTSATVAFGGAYGIFVVDQPIGFTGQISGLTGIAPNPSNSGSIYLAGFTESSYSTQIFGANEILTLDDASGDAVSLTFDNFSASLNVSMAGGYTIITDPPASSPLGAGSSGEAAMGSAANNQEEGKIPSIDTLLGNGQQILVPDTAPSSYSSAYNQGEGIGGGEGLNVNSQLQQLVGSMATYSATSPNFNQPQATQMPNDPTSLGGIGGAAWHH